MARLLSLLLCLLAITVFSAPARGDDRPEKLTSEQRKELEGKWRQAIIAGSQAFRAGKVREASKTFEDALGVAHRLYPKSEFPDGHDNLAASLNNLAYLYESQGRFVEAEPLYKEAIAITKRLFKEDHANVAATLNNLAFLYQAQGRLGEAEPLFRDASKGTTLTSPTV